MKKLIMGLAIISIIGGCASVDKYLATTTASYTPGGQFYYQSNKNQEGFHAVVKLDADGKVKELDIQTKATTPEAAMAAALSANAAMLETLNSLIKSLMAAKPPVMP